MLLSDAEELKNLRASYPRVSTIIGKQIENEMRAIPIDNLVNASIRGTAVHQYCTMYVRNLWIDEVNEEYAPYFEAFKVWYHSCVSSTLFSALRLYDDDKKFSGEFDMIVKLKTGERCLLDIKTSSAPSKSWNVQLAAYHHLCKIQGMDVDKVMILHLKGKYAEKCQVNEQGKKVRVSPPVIKTTEIVCTDLISSFEIFASALKCYDYFERKERT